MTRCSRAAPGSAFAAIVVDSPSTSHIPRSSAVISAQLQIRRSKAPHASASSSASACSVIAAICSKWSTASARRERVLGREVAVDGARRRPRRWRATSAMSASRPALRNALRAPSRTFARLRAASARSGLAVGVVAVKSGPRSADDYGARRAEPRDLIRRPALTSLTNGMVIPYPRAVNRKRNSSSIFSEGALIDDYRTPDRRAPKVARTGAPRLRAVRRRPRRLDRQRRAAVDRQGPRLLAGQPRLGRQRLHADLRRLPAARRAHGRPPRPPLACSWPASCSSRSPRSPAASPRPRLADRRACGPGPRRRDPVAGRAVDRHDTFTEGASATRRSASGARWPAPAAPPACCWAAC